MISPPNIADSSMEEAQVTPEIKRGRRMLNETEQGRLKDEKARRRTDQENKKSKRKSEKIWTPKSNDRQKWSAKGHSKVQSKSDPKIN